MSEDRTFRSLNESDREIIWRFCKQSPTGRWSGIAKAQQAIAQRRGPRGKTPSRPLIRAFLAEFPKKPEKRVRKGFKPKYIEKWEASEGYQKIIDYHRDFTKVDNTTVRKRLSLAKRAWLILNKKDPTTWNLDDFKRIEQHPEFQDVKRAKQFGRERTQMSFGHLVSLRAIIRALGNEEWLKFFGTKGTKRVKGAKRHWWLRKNEVRAIDEALTTQDLSAKILFIMACYTGSRIGAYMRATFGDLHLEIPGRERWEAFETKTGTPIDKELNARLVVHLKEYVRVMKIAGRAGHNDRLFPRGKQFYSDQLKKAAKQAGIVETGPDPNNPSQTVDDLIHGYRLSWHITRHTFASQLAEAGAPLQHIMQQGPWEDASTLLTYYSGADRSKIRETMNMLNLG